MRFLKTLQRLKLCSKDINMMKLSVGDFIFNSSDFYQDDRFSSKSDINYFFSNLPDEAIENWPLDMNDRGFVTEYISAKISNNSWKEDDFLIIQAKISNAEHSAIIEQEFRYGAYDNLIIKMNSLYKSAGSSPLKEMKIARLITQKNLAFLRSYDKEVKPSKSSAITVFASSEMTKQNIRTRGGYVWANNGFEFEDKAELAGIRKAFQSFLSGYGITISDNTLQMFTKPCHFAAYHCGKHIEIEGKKCPLGKAFLLRQSWNGIQKASSHNTVEQKYADAYYETHLPASRRKKALQVLSKKYRSLIDQSRKKNLIQCAVDKFRSMQRLAKLKFFEMHNR